MRDEGEFFKKTSNYVGRRLSYKGKNWKFAMMLDAEHTFYMLVADDNTVTTVFVEPVA